MKREDLIKIIIEEVKENSDADQIKIDSSFVDDLEMSSMEIYAFIGDLESRLRISISQRILNKASTIEELVDEIIKLL